MYLGLLVEACIQDAEDLVDHTLRRFLHELGFAACVVYGLELLHHDVPRQG